MRNVCLLLLALLVFAVGCGQAEHHEDEGELVLVKTPGPPSPVAGAPKVTSGGVKMWDVEVGKGAGAAKGQTAVIHYVCWLAADKTRVGSSRAVGHPYEFVIGAPGQIEGISQGIVGMKVGGKRRLEVPAKLAYGDAGKGDAVPPQADLIFDIELQGLK